MNAAVSDVQPKRLHVPRKALGDNFYPMMYGQFRIQRVIAMAEARFKTGEARADRVRAARKFNHEALWFLRRIAK